MSTTRSDCQNRVADLAPTNRRTFILLVLFLLSSAPLAPAQNGVQFRDWKTSLNEGAAVKPKRDCGALVSLTGYEFSIETAALVPASGDLPEYYHITGQIQPEVRFELSLPTSRNNRFSMFGNGGDEGHAAAPAHPPPHHHDERPL